MRVSAWVPFSDSLTPTRTIGELQAARISTAVLMVNDFSTARGPTAFRTFDVAKLTAMTTACWDAGIGVWLCSWVMPHDLFIDGALAQLPALIDATQAEMLVWDAEGPWCEATGKVDYAAACERLRWFGYSSTGVTAIGSAPAEVKPLTAISTVWMPQAYATTSVATPDRIVPYSLKCWMDRYGGEPGSWHLGLAGYEQAADPGVSMWPPIDDALAADIETVCYWTSNSIAARPDVTAFVRGLSEPARPHPGVMPEVRLAAMPSNVRVPVVAEVQALLVAWSVDPGKIDGKPGPKTIAGVQVFQRRKGLAPTGVVDAATWAELLRP